MTAKQVAIDLIEGLPREATIEDMLETVALRHMIEEGEISPGELPERQRIREWIAQTLRS